MLKLARIFTVNQILRLDMNKFASVIKMPSLSPTMTEGGIIEWHKKEGDKVAAGDLMCDIQTDKAVVAMEAEEDGILAKIIKPKDTQGIQIGETIGILADLDEDWKSVEIPSTTSPDSSKVQAISTSEVKSHESQPGKLSEKIGPAVRRLLDTYGLESNTIDPSGPHSILMKSDVLKFIDKNKKLKVEHKTKISDPKSPSSDKKVSSFVDIPLSAMNKKAITTASNVCLLPHFYFTIEVLWDRLSNLIEKLTMQGTHISTITFVVKACGLALKVFPIVNSGFDTSGNIKLYDTVDISVPLILNDNIIFAPLFGVNRSTISSINESFRSLNEKAETNQLGTLINDGGTFQITNVDVHGIKEFCSALINNSGLLAIGSSFDDLTIDMMDSSKLIPQKKVRLTLCIDGRIVDELTASKFLGHVRGYLENPELLLIDDDSIDLCSDLQT